VQGFWFAVEPMWGKEREATRCVLVLGKKKKFISSGRDNRKHKKLGGESERETRLKRWGVFHEPEAPTMFDSLSNTRGSNETKHQHNWKTIREKKEISPE